MINADNLNNNINDLYHSRVQVRYLDKMKQAIINLIEQITNKQFLIKQLTSANFHLKLIKYFEKQQLISLSLCSFKDE
ncbi:unnamed protein product [Paramecium primaurelia]|uniref:Uncharacterized protein n=1 Tax=Paramecium primaurelia TaxID=5886 RepID=A0A8S1PMR7_PARPR|nr:unnamed protein product [Paramecium primaurelia]